MIPVFFTPKMVAKLDSYSPSAAECLRVFGDVQRGT
jgi:hypothetical protein